MPTERGRCADLREQLAAIEHERWSHWQRWMHQQGQLNPDGSLTLPAELVQRWERQSTTPYSALSDAEKQSDRDQVTRYWHLIEPLTQTATAYVVWGDYDPIECTGLCRTLDSIHTTRESALSRVAILHNESEQPPHIAEWKLHG